MNAEAIGIGEDDLPGDVADLGLPDRVDAASGGITIDGESIAASNTCAGEIGDATLALRKDAVRSLVVKPHQVEITAIATFTLALMPLALAQTRSATQPVDWKTMIPAIREVLRTESKTNPEFGSIEDHYAIEISKTADITGDGVPEALVYLGTGGASAGEMTVMSLEDHKPVLSAFRRRDGKISSMVFLQGASVMHTDTVELLPQQHAVQAIHFDYGGNGKLHHCGGEAYTWNAHSKRFDYNSELTKKLTEETCRQVPKAVR